MPKIIPKPLSIRSYNAAQRGEAPTPKKNSKGTFGVGEAKKICNLLMREMNKNLKGAESKVWHGSPVWFFDGNPVAGYGKLKDSVQLLFWSGQTFKEPGLTAEGSFKAAEKRYTSVTEVNMKDLRRWLVKAKKIQWDYKNIIKRRGRLVRIKSPHTN